MTINNIIYLDKYISNDIFYISNPLVKRFYFNDTLEIIKFKNNLKKDKLYVLSLHFICSWEDYEEDIPVINLSKPILITKNSNPRIISNIIKSRVNQTINLYLLDEIWLNNSDAPGVLIKYKEINLFLIKYYFKLNIKVISNLFYLPSFVSNNMRI
jgi:hypothetical protein